MVSGKFIFISLVALLMETILVTDQKAVSFSLITVAVDFVAIIFNGTVWETVNKVGGIIALFITGVWIHSFKNRDNLCQYTLKPGRLL